MSELTKMPGVGKVLAAQLEAVGIKTCEQLKKEGTEAVFLRLKELDPGSCMHKLYAIESAVQGIKKAEIPEERKTELKAFFRQGN